MRRRFRGYGSDKYLLALNYMLPLMTRMIFVVEIANRGGPLLWYYYYFERPRLAKTRPVDVGGLKDSTLAWVAHEQFPMAIKRSYSKIEIYV